MSCKSDSNECKKCQGKSLTEIVKCYRKKSAPLLKDELDHFSTGKSPKEVQEKSCGSILENKKMHSHQCRVGTDVLADVRETLDGFKFSKYDCFDALHSAVGKRIQDIPRVGPLTIYDISLRLAYSVGKVKCPDHVYLHAGALEGARNLYQKNYPSSWSTRCLGMKDFPKEFSILEPMQIESLLCICKVALKNLKSSQK